MSCQAQRWVWELQGSQIQYQRCCHGGVQGWQQGWAAGIAAISKAGSSPGSALCLAGGERHLQKPLLQRKSFFRSLERFAKVNE